MATAEIVERHCTTLGDTDVEVRVDVNGDVDVVLRVGGGPFVVLSTEDYQDLIEFVNKHGFDDGA